MNDLRAAAQQALEAYSGGPNWRGFADAMDALRAALAQPPMGKASTDVGVPVYVVKKAEPVQEPCNKSCAPGYCYCAVQQAEPTRSQQMADAGFTRRPSLWSLQAREALELIAAPQRPDGTWNRDREACRQLAAEALGRYDDE